MKSETKLHIAAWIGILVGICVFFPGIALLYHDRTSTSLPWMQESCAGIPETSASLTSHCCFTSVNSSGDVFLYNCSLELTINPSCPPEQTLWCQVVPPIRAPSQRTEYATQWGHPLAISLVVLGSICFGFSACFALFLYTCD